MAAPTRLTMRCRSRALPAGALALAIMGTILAGLSGCSSDKPPPPPPPTRVEAKITAAQDVNPDPRGLPSPVFLRVYELRAETAFANSDFFNLYEDDSAVLGKDLLKRWEIVLRPGEKQPLSRDLDAEVQFLGFVVAYQEIDRATWRALIRVAREKTTAVKVQLGPRDIAVQVESEPEEKRIKKKG